MSTSSSSSDENSVRELAGMKVLVFLEMKAGLRDSAYRPLPLTADEAREEPVSDPASQPQPAVDKPVETEQPALEKLVEAGQAKSSLLAPLLRQWLKKYLDQRRRQRLLLWLCPPGRASKGRVRLAPDSAGNVVVAIVSCMMWPMASFRTDCAVGA